MNKKKINPRRIPATMADVEKAKKGCAGQNHSHDMGNILFSIAR